MRFEPFPSIPAIPDPVPLSDQIKPKHRLHLVPLSDDLAAVFFDAPDFEALPTSLMTAWSGDEALCRPLLGSRLTRRDGGLRYVFFLARSSRELCRKGLWISASDALVAEIDPSALQSPVVDALALVVGLTAEGERRLLRALLTTGLSLFGDRIFHGIRDIALQLLERLSPPPLPLRAWCPLGRTAAIASYTLPRDMSVGKIGTLVEIGESRAHQRVGADSDVEMLGEDRLLHVFLPDGASAGTTLVSLADQPMRLAGPSPEQRQRPLGPWLARRTPQIRRRTLDRLTGLAAGDATAAALVAEVSCPKPALPEVTSHLAGCTTSGVFFIVGVRDPRHLLSKLILRTEDGDTALPLGAPLHHPALGAVQLGYVKAAQDWVPGDEAQLFALYRSGRMSRVGPVALQPFFEMVPAVLEDLPAADIAPPLAAALADALRDRHQVQTEVLPVAAPDGPARMTLVVELGASLDYPYALAASLAGHRDIGLLLHHPDRRALPALRALGEELHAIYGIGVDLLDIAEEDLLPAERMRAALAAAGTDAAVFLSGDVLPQANTWSERWLDRLSRPGPVLAGAAVQGHDVGGGEDAISEGAVSGRQKNGPSARCVGLNAAARAVLSRMPLRVAGSEADVADLAATLRQEPGALVVMDPAIRMTAHTPPPDNATRLHLAERLILAEETTACGS